VLDNLTKVFGDGDQKIVAVDGLDMEIKEGELIVFVGPSGCGKSTTLRCIAGLEHITSGDIRLGGQSIADQPPTNRNIAMVFQNYALYPHMTARQNIGFGLKMSTDMSKEEIDTRVSDTAETMGINDLLEKKPDELSGGQQQRVALGRAIVRDPDVFLLDEPLSNLDAKLRTEMRTEIQELQQDLGVTTIYVTHDQTEAMTMGDRIVVLNKGKLQQVGTPLECYYNPTNRFVAGFIGSPNMNFFDVQLEDEQFVHSAFDYPTGDILDKHDINSAALTLGIRPEDIEIAPEPRPDTVNATVNVVEPMGDVTITYLQVGDISVTASLGDATPDVGTELNLYFPEDRIYLFNQESGEAIKTHEDPDKQTITP